MASFYDEELSLAIVEHNINVFAKLMEHQKIIIDNQSKVNVDDRYLQSLRRTLDWLIWSCDSSRQATFNIIELTYKSLKNYKDYYISNIDKINQSLNNLENKLAITYPDYLGLFSLINEFQTFYSSYIVADKSPIQLSSYYLFWYSYLNSINNKKYISSFG